MIEDEPLWVCESMHMHIGMHIMSIIIALLTIFMGASPFLGFGDILSRMERNVNEKIKNRDTQLNLYARICAFRAYSQHQRAIRSGVCSASASMRVWTSLNASLSKVITA